MSKQKGKRKITGSCSPKCWFAAREKCECICDGKNHQIGLSKGKGDLKEVQKMKEKFEEYQKQRKLERRMRRQGVSYTPEAHKIMRKIIGGK